MADGLSGARHREELLRVIREVRSRWRMKLLLRGGIAIVGGALLALVLASYGLQVLKFSETSVTTLRVATIGLFALLVVLWFVRPLRRRVTDMQVALYVEEHDPSLQAAMLSAVEVGAPGAPGAPGTEAVPAVIIERLVTQAVEKCRTLDGGKAIGRTDIRRNATVLASLFAATVLLLIVGPEFLRQGASALLILSKSAQAASPYAIQVTPGDATVPKGSDQTIQAKLAGFRSNDVALMVKADGDTQFERMPLVATGDPTTFEGMLFAVKKPIQYYVDSDGVRSPTYLMKVVNLPAVAGLELEYVFPAYTGLPPQKVESGGDVAALRGTEVRVKIKPTMATPGGRLQLEPKSTSELATQADGTLTGGFKIDQDGFYHVELDGARGEHVTASPKYTVDAIEDQPPSVSFEKPKRDTSASPVEEAFVQARADDDYGVKQLDLIYSVNGGPEKTVTLYGNGVKALKSVSAGHTIYLEELGVKPGDFVAYYAKAQDNDTVKGPKTSTSDIYFIKIRPLNQSFREAQSQGGGGGGGGGNQVGALSEQEKQIISATFNVERDRAKTPANKFKENTVFIGLAQSKLRDQVGELLQNMNQRVSADDNLKKIADVLPKAVEEMKAAEKSLQGLKTKEAMSPEQRALKYLQDAEQMYELEVRRRQQQGGGGGGGGGQMAEDLADLFQLQADRMANQYEQQQSASDQSAQQKIDEAAERLKELARRQQAQAEQQRRAAQQQGGASGSAQRALADEVDQLKRQLEQLQRESQRQGQQRQDLADAVQRLQNAEDAMRRAAANGTQDGGAQAQQALQLLQQVQQQLQQSGARRATQDARSAQQQVQELQKQERDVASQVAGLDQMPTSANKESKVQQLMQQKDAMRSKLTDVQQQLGQLGNQALANNQKDAARKFQEAAGTITQNQIREKIEFSKRAMANGSEYAKPVESQIGSDLDTLAKQVGDAAVASDKAQQGNTMARALNQSGNAVRSLQSLTEQLNQATGQNGQQGQQGEQGQGQQAQRGQGQQGGQQGQGQQGQGQQGQQGQGGQGQQAQNGQGGRPGQNNGPRGQNGQPGGDPNQLATSGGGSAVGGTLRQIRSQANQLAGDVQDLRRQMQTGGADPNSLQSVDDVAKGLRDVGNERGSADPRTMAQLMQQALQKMQQVDLDLRRKFDTSNQQLYLAGSDEVPSQYRQSVADYFRAIGSKKAGGGATPAPKATPAKSKSGGK